MASMILWSAGGDMEADPWHQMSPQGSAGSGAG
jgi:hypothetical protein